MSPDAEELLRLRQLERENPSSSPLIAVIRRSTEADLISQAEAAGGAVELELCGGWRIGVVTDEHREKREAAERRAFRERMAASQTRRRRRRR